MYKVELSLRPSPLALKHLAHITISRRKIYEETIVLSLHVGPLFAAGGFSAGGGPKVEIFGGYSYLCGDTLDGVNAHGFNTSLAVNITKHVGIIGEFSRFTSSRSFPGPVLGSITIDVNVLAYLFGPRIVLHRSLRVVAFCLITYVSVYSIREHVLCRSHYACRFVY